MSTFYNWILNGPGRGKRYLLYLAVFFAAFSSFVVYFSWNGIISAPASQKIIQSLPDLKVQNGTLILPEDTYQDIAWTMATEDKKPLTTYHFIIDTQSDDLDSAKAPANGIYLSRKNAYILNDGSVTVQPWENMPSFDIKQGQLSSILQRGNIRFSWILFFALSFVLFITFYIWSFIYAALSYFLTMFIPGDNYSFAVRRRLSVAGLICAYLFAIPLSFWGFYLSVFIFFLTVLIFMSIFLTGLPKIMIIPIDN